MISRRAMPQAASRPCLALCCKAENAWKHALAAHDRARRRAGHRLRMNARIVQLTRIADQGIGQNADGSPYRLVFEGELGASPDHPPISEPIAPSDLL